ncbi:septation ring formation regulator EzrA [Jeotgalibaca sp. MA1X17-3]|uniref:septation ring formation regulator EzrA n=1 Tax=Jeotgalibaca sp. MA1X17-3 TaxID=2908211 RepID=UPI001F357242|nr:septation ring formation regulator EzrA [Jeotgalibaca sp. MA1X17-3]UJF15108.1 septation ring formation regulator EzrA [Jeotgalibaca sp. MA1X17-3]
MDLIYWLMLIFIIVLIGYGTVFYLNRRQANRIKEVNHMKQKMMLIPVADNLYTLKNLNLTGQTKRTYESWQATWQTITRFQYPEIEASLERAQQYIQQMNFVKAKQAIDDGEKLIEETHVSVEKVNAALEGLLESARQNREELEAIHERYNKIRKKLLAHSFIFGPAIETLEKNLNYLELDFSKFNSLTNEGDHMEAKEILDRIEQDLTAMESVVEKIPELNSKIKEEYEEQLEDIREGYERLLADQYVFDKVNVPNRIKDVEGILHQAKESISHADINEAQKKMDKAEREIETIYDVLEEEMIAKDFVDRHQANLSRKMDHVLQSNRYVLLEIDRVSQNFFLNKNELARAGSFEEQLLKENETLRFYEKKLADHRVSYTAAKEYYEKIGQRLNEIDKEQSDLVSNLSKLRNREKQAREAIDYFEIDIRDMKRVLEKQHLPGLPKVYLDLFFVVSDRIEEVSSKLNRVKIDMEEVERLMKMCEEDIDMLGSRTEEILDDANLTESYIQYANRFRNDVPEVEKAVRASLHYFNEEFDYEKAKKTIQTALEKEEPGASRKVEESYLEEKKRASY